MFTLSEAEHAFIHGAADWGFNQLMTNVDLNNPRNGWISDTGELVVHVRACVWREGGGGRGGGREGESSVKGVGRKWLSGGEVVVRFERPGFWAIDPALPAQCCTSVCTACRSRW